MDCEQHTNVDAPDFCPVCLIEERDRLKSENLVLGAKDRLGDSEQLIARLKLASKWFDKYTELLGLAREAMNVIEGELMLRDIYNAFEDLAEFIECEIDITSIAEYDNA